MKQNTIVIASTDISVGGLGSYIVTLGRCLKMRGWHVHLLTTNEQSTFAEALDDDFHYYDISLVPLSPNKIIHAARLINSVMPDVLLINNCALVHYALPLLDSSIKPVSVLHSNDTRFFVHASIFSKWIFRWVSPAPGLVIPMKSFIPEHQHSRIRVIHHGVNKGIYHQDTRRKESGRFQIIFVGFLGASKGAHLLPEIFQQVLELVSNSFLTIVGDGPLRTELDASFQRRGIRNRVTMTGMLSREETAEALRSSDIFLLPTNLEGFGLAIVEAMMCGVVPVVSLLQGVTDQIVEQARTGFLVQPTDIRGFVETIAMLGDDDVLRRLLSQACSQIAREKFGDDRMVAHYISVFNEDEDRVAAKTHRFWWFALVMLQIITKRIHLYRSRHHSGNAID